MAEFCAGGEKEADEELKAAVEGCASKKHTVSAREFVPWDSR